jgi:hypothetical protein
MRSMVEGESGKGRPLRKPPSVRPLACHLPVPGRNNDYRNPSILCV